jgi:hypothetical protein
VRDAVLEKLNVSGRTLSAVDTTHGVEFDYEEVISLDDYDTGSRSVLKTDATLEESQAKRVCSRSQVEREAQDLRNRLEQSRTFRRETGLMNFPADRLGPPVQTAPISRASDDYRMPPDDGIEPYRRRDSRSPAHGHSWGGRTPAVSCTGRPRDRSRSRKRRSNNKPRQDTSPRADRGRKRARSVERGSSSQARIATVSRGRALEPMRIMHMQNIMDAPIPEEMTKLPPLAAATVDPPAEPSTVHPDHAETTPEEKSETPALKAASFKIPKLSVPQPTARTHSGEKTRCQKPVSEGDETMAVDLDLEVSEEDRKFVESSTSDNIGKLLDKFIGDKKSPEKNVPKPVLKKPEDTVKRPAITTGKRLSFADDPPKSALSLMAAALKKPSRANKTDGKSDEVELRHLSSAQRATFRKMLTSTALSPKKSSKKGRK